MIHSGGLPRRGPRRRSTGTWEELERVKAILRRIEAFGMSVLDRAQLACAIRRLLKRDPWDGPPSAA